MEKQEAPDYPNSFAQLEPKGDNGSKLNRPSLLGKFHKNQGVKTLGQPTP